MNERDESERLLDEAEAAWLEEAGEDANAASTVARRVWWQGGYIRARSREREQTLALLEALRPFAAYGGWIEAAAEMGEVEDLTDHTCIASLSVGGGSDYLWMVDLRRAATALAAYEAAHALQVAQ